MGVTYLETIIIITLSCLLIFNITFYIPHLLKKQEEKISLHFKEIQIRLNRMEKLIETNKNRSEI